MHAKFVLAAPLALLAVTLPGRVDASAWTQPEGSTFVSASTSILEPEDSDAVRDSTLSVYVEHGLFERLTVGGSLEWKIDRDRGFSTDPDTGDDAPSALSAAGFARLQLWEGQAGDPLSVQVGYIGALSSPSPDTGLFAEEEAIDLRVLYGRGFATGWGNGWASVEGALRLLREGGADEIRLDATAGLRPLPRALVYLQSFATVGLRNADPGGSDFDEWKLAPSIGYDLGHVTLVGSVERTVLGRNVGEDTRFRLSFWTLF